MTQLRPPARACIIGAGGGRDILTALKAGASDVDAVELNGAIVNALSTPLRAFTGDVYHLPGVHAHVDEGRSFLTRSNGDYDLIQISLIDSWAATAAGAFALSENYLYTTEALRLYWRRTSPSGLVSISRWMAGDRQLEAARLAKLATVALELEVRPMPSVTSRSFRVGARDVSPVEDGVDAAALAKLDAIVEARGSSGNGRRVIVRE
jgi:spermidine synthase